MSSRTTDEDVSDAELLAEIAKEAEALNNDTLPANSTQRENIHVDTPDTVGSESNIGGDDSADYSGGAQLTAFQENIITTGSDVSVLLMLILLVLFVIQMVRKTYNYFSLQSKIQNVVNPLDDARPIAAENLTPINPGYDHKSYAVYNTEFEYRNVYLTKQKDGVPASVLKDILLDRAVKCIERLRAIQRDGVGIRKNWNMDLLPRDVWDDFNAAQRNIQAEIECVVKENQRLGFQWGQPHKDNIFSRAKQMHENRMMIKGKAYRQKMEQRQMQHMQQQKAKKQIQQQQQNTQQKARGTGPQAPNAKTFGNGFHTGFFNNNTTNSAATSGSKRLTKKEKNELKRQKKAMKSSGQPTMLQDNIQNPTDSSNAGQHQQTQARRRKGKRRFASK